MTDREFWNACESFNWQFENSSSHEVWLTGTEFMKNLVTKINNKEKQEIYDGFHAHNFSGVYYGTEQYPKPEKP